MSTQENFNQWLNRITLSDMPGADIRAFNFGIFEDQKVGYKLYITGSKIYDSEDDDWATEEDYIPQEKYFNLNIKSHEDDWEQVQDKVVEMIGMYQSNPDYRNSFLKEAKAVTTGFDDGELLRVI